MGDALVAQELGGVPGVIVGGVEGDEQIAEEGFDARLACFARDAGDDFFAAGVKDVAQAAELRAAMSDGVRGPSSLRGARAGHEGGQFRERRARNAGDDFAGCGIARFNDVYRRYVHSRHSTRICGREAGTMTC